MNFKILKQLVVMFKKRLKCTSCNKSMSQKEINIDAISKQKVMFRCECSRCKNVIFAEVALFKETDAINAKSPHRIHQGLKLKSKKPHKISENDILDVKNFLKTFKGDFKEIFRK